MASPVLLEICVESLSHAVAAEIGGADRIELCLDLSCGGVTPTAELMRAARRQVRIPIHVLIRPRAGNFCYSYSEVETMRRDIAVAQDSGLDGIVLGLLEENRQVDREGTRALVQSAHPLPVTFHRAFDQCPDLDTGLEAVIASGAKRILTSGGKTTVMEGLSNVAHLIKAAAGRIVIMPGGGIRGAHVEPILRLTGAREIHTSLNGAGPDSIDAASFEKRVRQFTCSSRFSVLGSQ